MCALEAMALGTPVVSTPTDGMKDLIHSGVNGYLSDDDAELAASIDKLLKEPEHRARLSQKAREDFARINDPEAYKAAIAACYGEQV